MVTNPTTPAHTCTNQCSLCGWSGDAGSCPNCNGDRGLKRTPCIACDWETVSVENANAQKSDPEAPERLDCMSNKEPIARAIETLRRFINSPKTGDQLVAWRALDTLHEAIPTEDWVDVPSGETLIAGEVYRITSLAPWDKYPGHCVGDVFTAKAATLFSCSKGPGDFEESWCAVHSDGRTSLVTGLQRRAV